ncbi:MAG: phosphoenolpyruvate carboxylase, partial [Myxococcota bacterium]
MANDLDPPRPLFSPEDEPLRRDVGTLGTLLGDVLRDQQGYALFGRVETARQLARRWREGDAGALKELEGSLRDLENDVATSLVEAFSMYFGLVNTAQRVHRMRRRRDYLKLGEPQPGSFAASLRTLRDRGVTREELQARLGELRLQPVFTAHPTEAVRRTILKKEQRIVRALFDRLDPTTLTPEEELAAKARIVEEITASFQTEAHHPERPTVGDEVEHVVFYLSEVIYRIVPPLFEALEDAIQRAYGEAVEIPLTLLRFGSWVGGDMDGNPNVGPATIESTLERHRAIVLGKYRAEVAELFEHLSHSTTRVSVSPGLDALLESYRGRFPEALAGVSSRYARMPYRLVLHVVDERLRRTLEDAEGAYAQPAELRGDIDVLLQSLEASGGQHSGAHRLRRFQRRVATFGFHLAALDVRQDALLHRQAIAALLGDADFPARAPAERAAAIRAWLDAPQDAPEEPGETLGEVLAVMRALSEARARFGPEATGPYIIS